MVRRVSRHVCFSSASLTSSLPILRNFHCGRINLMSGATNVRPRVIEDGFCDEEEIDSNPSTSIPQSASSSSSDLASTGNSKAKVSDGEILSFVDRVLTMSANAGDKKYNLTPVHKRFDKDAMRFVGEHENTVLEVQRLSARYKQQGPYITSAAKDVQVLDVDRRSRREIDRVPQMEAPYVPNETSFRRLPKNFRIPVEQELQVLYPQPTKMEMVYDEANCVDHDGANIDDEPPPIRFWKVFPPNYDPNKAYPHMVILSDGVGTKEDFADVLANFFERPALTPGREEQQWVLFGPEIASKRSWKMPNEAVVAHFCDWVVDNFNVEHGRCHLFGKGYGAYAALQTCLEQKNVAISCTAILGRSGTPFRVMNNAQEKVKNLQGVHTLMYVPGRLKSQDWVYKFKFMMDYGEVKPAMRCIHFAEVSDHQIYYAINPYEFWNHMRFFRQHNNRMLTEEELNGAASHAARNDTYEPAFTQWEINAQHVQEEGEVNEREAKEKDRVEKEKAKASGVGGAFSGINVEEVSASEARQNETSSAENRTRRN